MVISRPVRIYPTPTIPRNAKARRVSTPPPVGGWNTRDDPVRMGPTDAYELINFYPEINEVGVRRGYTEHATGVGSGDVDTVIEFFNGTTRRLLAASSTNIYNATSAGAASSLGSGFTSGRWQAAIQNGVMGLVNGADAPQTYDGTTLGAMTVSGTTATELIGIHIFKNRSYFWKADSPSFWYSAVDTLGGVLSEFALGEVALRGGNLVAMESWTVDGGSGTDDFAVFVMESGEVLVYQGSDPGSASDWALVGSYLIPKPLDIRCVQKVGAQVVVLTENDYVFLPSAFGKPAPPATKLRGAIELAGPTYRANTGWQTLYYPKRQMLLHNIPIDATTFEQYVVNTETDAPARFIDQNARAWGLYNSDIYFGTTDGRVMVADTESDDDGSNINADAGTAWTDLGDPNNKKVEAYRPVFSGLSTFRTGCAISYDYREKAPGRVNTVGGGGTPWGSPWGSPWSTALEIRDGWKMASGYGQVLSIQISIGVNGSRPVWYRNDFQVGVGANL